VVDDVQAVAVVDVKRKRPGDDGAMMMRLRVA
jgi:hypothetical protein